MSADPKTTPSRDTGPARPRRLSLVTVTLLVLLVPLVPFVVIGELPGERWLSSTGEDAVVFGALGAGLLAIDVVLPVPSTVVGTLLGARLGFLPGLCWIWSGLMIGNGLGYLLGRVGLGRWVEALPQTPTLLVLVLSRPVPVLAEAATIAAGAGRMPVAPFFVATGAANAVLALALAGNGAALLPDAVVGPGLVLPLALPVVAWLIWRWRSRRDPHR